MTDSKQHSPGGQPEKPERSTPEVRYVPVDVLHGMHDDDDEIDLLELVKTVWDGRRLVAKTVAVFVVLGLIVALGSGVEYTSEVRMMPEYLSQDQSRIGGGGLGGLAQQFGINIGSQQTYDAIPPRLYPDVTQSVTFMRQLLEYEVALPGNPGETVPLETYFLDHYSPPVLTTIKNYTILLPFTLLRGVRYLLAGEETGELTPLDRQLAGGTGKAERLIRMDPIRWELVRMLRERINATWNQESTSVTVSVKMPDPVMAADIADEVVQLLSETITEYRTEKLREDLEFIEERYREAENRFEEAQRELARFSDENRGQLTALARTQEQLLQSRYDLTYNLYNSMAQRLEEARIKLQEETPVLNIMDPAAVPDQKSEPKRLRVLVLFTVFGIIIGIGLIFALQFWKTLRDKLAS